MILKGKKMANESKLRTAFKLATAAFYTASLATPQEGFAAADFFLLKRDVEKPKKDLPPKT